MGGVAASVRAGPIAGGARGVTGAARASALPVRRCSALLTPRRAATSSTRRGAVVLRASALGGEFPAFDAAAGALANVHAAIITNDAVASVLFQVADGAAVSAPSELASQFPQGGGLFHPDFTPGVVVATTAAAVAVAGDVADIPGLQKGGWLGPITDLLESILKAIDGGLESAGVPYSYGFAIILLTLSVKLATFPLTKKQVESSIEMQSLQPKVAELKAMYANDPERLQMETARLYKEANFNPLAGCLPTFATLPVFIGLYRALSNAATEGVLTQGFFWIPSLGGPTSIADRNDGNGYAWLWPLVDGHPPMGWHDTISYLILPVLLVVSQFVSQKVLTPEQPKSADPAQANSQAILKFLPLMIGFFSLNVPAGLTLYWFANNLLSTGQTLLLRKITPVPVLASAAALPMPGTPAALQPVRVEYVPKSQRNKSSGGGAPVAPLAPKPPPPRVESMGASMASEFADFDDGPTKVVEVVQGQVVNGSGAAAASASAAKKMGAGSRKRRSRK